MSRFSKEAEGGSTIDQKGLANLDGIAAVTDEQILFQLGYRQEFRRKFTVWSSFCLSFSSLGLLPSVAAILAYSLG